MTDAFDQLSRCIFAAGLTLTSIVNGQGVDDAVAQRLVEVIEALDTAVRDLRAISLASLVGDRDVTDTPVHPVTASGMPACAEDSRDAGTTGRRYLHRVDGSAFAYARHGHDYVRATDHILWAHESEGLLLSARSGTPFARRVGDMFYDVDTNEPLYYEHEHSHTPAPPSQS